MHHNLLKNKQNKLINKKRECQDSEILVFYLLYVGFTNPT